MLNKFTGLTIAFLMLTAIVSASTLVTYEILMSDDSEDFVAKVDFAEGTNHYTLIEIDEGDNDEEKSVTLILHEFVFSVTGEKDSVTWDFGDGQTSSLKSPQHSWAEAGNYFVSLTVEDGNGQEGIETKNIEIKALGPTAKFVFKEGDTLKKSIHSSVKYWNFSITNQT